MPKMLNGVADEYEDGTPATESQVGFSYFPEAYFRFSGQSLQIACHMLMNLLYVTDKGSDT